MKKLFIKISRTFGKLIGKKKGTALIIFIYKLTDAPLLKIALNQYGILKPDVSYYSGEKFALNRIYKYQISNDEVIIDIGANKGEYTQQAEALFTKNKIISIEANPFTFKKLKENVSSDCYNYAIGQNNGTIDFYTSKENPISYLSSFKKETIPENETPIKLKVNGKRLDSFINEYYPEAKIGLLKIDAEGHDFEVLLSGEVLLNNIKFIQFEFNDMYVYTRTFLLDFYQLLNKTHGLFRLDTNKLHDIQKYHTNLEVFRYQNIVAIRKDLIESLDNDLIKRYS